VKRVLEGKMKCKHCGYKDEEWIKKENDPVGEYKEGGHGDFYELSNDVKMTKGSGLDKEIEEVYGCPRCGILFMNI
jgi:DNA-directed RNA polymerase subunit RPC12/RpoP